MHRVFIVLCVVLRLPAVFGCVLRLDAIFRFKNDWWILKKTRRNLSTSLWNVFFKQ